MNAVILLSGGTGTRMGGDIPKQYLMAGNRPVISYCLETFEESGLIDRIMVVAAPEYRDLIRSLVKNDEKPLDFADPGSNRQLSILSGLRALKDFLSDDDNVIIHDAARPMVKKELIEKITDALKGSDAVLPVLPMKDTVYEVEGGRVLGNLDRSRIAAGQAPEGFKFGKYLRANEDLLPDRILEISGSMQPAVMCGMDIRCIDGDEDNFKITTPADLKRFKEIKE